MATHLTQRWIRQYIGGERFIGRALCYHTMGIAESVSGAARHSQTYKNNGTIAWGAFLIENKHRASLVFTLWEIDS